MQGKIERYEFRRGDRGVFAEIYFPKKAVHQGTIFDALSEGYYENKVKDYLSKNIDKLLEELEDYPDLFDPDQYDLDKPRQKPIIIGTKEAEKRIEKYCSPFKGWSLYQVDGVFFDKKDKLIEEATQVVRVIFRYESHLAQEAESLGCKDVLRSMMFWTISYQGRLDDHIPWDRGELNRYLQHHEPWSDKKRAFAEQHFSDVARKTQQWIDDCALFLFGYLVRKFWENVLKEELNEDEIWVTSFFNLTVNVIKKRDHQSSNDNSQ